MRILAFDAVGLHQLPPSQAAIARGLAYAPYADLLWVETSTPDLGEATEFANAIHAKYPGKLLAYNCSPSFNWKRHLSDSEIASFQVRQAVFIPWRQGYSVKGFSMKALKAALPSLTASKPSFEAVPSGPC